MQEEGCIRLMAAIINQAITDYTEATGSIKEAILHRDRLEKKIGKKWAAEVRDVLTCKKQIKGFVDKIENKDLQEHTKLYIKAMRQVEHKEVLIHDCVTFFKSSWCEYMTGMSYEVFMYQLRLKVEREERAKLERQEKAKKIAQRRKERQKNSIK